jgi:hypothetical protein
MLPCVPTAACSPNNLDSFCLLMRICLTREAPSELHLSLPPSAETAPLTNSTPHSAAVHMHLPKEAPSELHLSLPPSAGITPFTTSTLSAASAHLPLPKEAPFELHLCLSPAAESFFRLHL